jgi:hypothetical protein
MFNKNLKNQLIDEYLDSKLGRTSKKYDNKDKSRRCPMSQNMCEGVDCAWYVDNFGQCILVALNHNLYKHNTLLNNISKNNRR